MLAHGCFKVDIRIISTFTIFGVPMNEERIKCDYSSKTYFGTSHLPGKSQQYTRVAAYINVAKTYVVIVLSLEECLTRIFIFELTMNGLQKITQILMPCYNEGHG